MLQCIRGDRVGHRISCRWMFMGDRSLFKTIPGVINTEAGRVNGTTNNLDGPYDGMQNV